MEWFWSQNRRKITHKNGSRVLCGECSRRRSGGIVYDRGLRMRRRFFLIFFITAAQDGVATEVLAAVAAVVAAAACFRRLRAQQLAATTREIDELRDKLAQQQAPPAPPAPVAQAK